MTNNDKLDSVDEILQRLKESGMEKVRIQNTKRGAGENQFGVRLGDIRKLAKKVKKSLPLALELWDTNNIDSRFLSLLLIHPKDLTVEKMTSLVTSIGFDRVSDWFNSYIAKKHPNHEELRIKWMESENSMAARASWFLTAEKIKKNPTDLNIEQLLNRLEEDMGTADPLVQWTMNLALVEIGINFPTFRERSITIGNKLGLYKDYPVPKGCLSPFAPIWIKEMVSRQK